MSNLENYDSSKMELSFTTIDEIGYQRQSHFTLGMTPGNNNMNTSAMQELERTLEAKEDELMQLKNRLDNQMVEIQGKDADLE